MKTKLPNTVKVVKVALGAVVVFAGLTLPAEAQRGRPYYYDGGYYEKPRRWPRHRRKPPRPVPAVSVEVRVQQELARRGYYRGVIDGDVGPRTRSAIRAYQVDKRLPVTGVIDGPLLRSLRLL